MKYLKLLICLTGGMSIGFFISFLIESLNQNPHEGTLLFESLSWYLSIFLVGVGGFFAGRKKWKKTS
ncbi:hypothetical protein AB3N59_18660 [Leptospira sp. WS92.C1]